MVVSYVSTRDRALDEQGLDRRTFADVLVAGLAPDGGLYSPQEIPALPPTTELAALGGLNQPGRGTHRPGLDHPDYVKVAAGVMWPFVEGSIDRDEFDSVVADAYQGFSHPDVCPVIDMGDNLYLLDLTRGPTVAFKDVALQLLGRLLDRELAARNRPVTVITATSGDTGSAAIEALAGRTNIEVVVLHPHGRVSDIQRKQMTTVRVDNVHNVAIEGTFDDCQNLVKAMFAQPELGGNRPLAAVNSINWARVMAQTVYYVTAALTVAPDGGPVSFAVPTGNFGNVLAAWYAKQMGLNVDQLVVASNRNDVLPRFFATGRLEVRGVQPSLSPSMDIQISSNFERLLWEASGHDGQAIDDLMNQFASHGSVEVPPLWVDYVRSQMTAVSVDDPTTLAEIKRIYAETELIVDPHTAVGVYAARNRRTNPETPMVIAATASPAKFGDAVGQALGVRPPLPAHMAELMDRQEHFTVLRAELDSLAQILRNVEAAAVH